MPHDFLDVRQIYYGLDSWRQRSASRRIGRWWSGVDVPSFTKTTSGAAGALRRCTGRIAFVRAFVVGQRLGRKLRQYDRGSDADDPNRASGSPPPAGKTQSGGGSFRRVNAGCGTVHSRSRQHQRPGSAARERHAPHPKFRWDVASRAVARTKTRSGCYRWHGVESGAL